MGGNTTPNINSQNRGRVTTPSPQQGFRGSQLIRPPAASIQPPMAKVNPPMAPFGGLNLNPMPKLTPGVPPQLQTVPRPGVNNTMGQIQNPNNPTMVNPLQPAPIQNPNNPTMVNPLQLDEQGNPIDNGMSNSMSMFNPNMMLRPY